MQGDRVSNGSKKTSKVLEAVSKRTEGEEWGDAAFETEKKSDEKERAKAWFLARASR